MDVVDTHAHLYSEETDRYPLMRDPYLPPPGRGTLEHLRAEMTAAGVRRAVFVHTFTAYRWDNRLLADATAASREFATGVCALSPHDPESPELLAHYHRGCGVRGIRLFPVAVDDANGPRSFTLPGHERLWRAAAELGMVVCALIHPDELGTLREYLRRYPTTPVVLDHCANLTAAEAPDGPNLRAVLALAAFPNVYPKVTFLVTGSGEPYPCPDTRPLGRRIVAEFGAERCMWGSNFPCELWIPATDYAGHLRIFTEHLGLSRADQAEVLGGTAARLWFPGE